MSYIDEKGQIHRGADVAMADDDPAHPSAFLDRGIRFHRSRQYTLAINNYAAFIEAFPYDAEGYLFRGCALRDTGEYYAALLDLNRALQLAPQRAEILFHKAEAYRLMESYAEAVENDTQAIQHGKEDAEVYAHRGFCRMKAERYEGAVDDLRKSLMLDGADQIAKRNLQLASSMLAVRRYEGRDLAGALEAITLAIEFGKRDAWAYKVRGICLHKVGNYSEAACWLEKSLELAPDDADVAGLLNNARSFFRDTESTPDLVMEAETLEPEKDEPVSEEVGGNKPSGEEAESMAELMEMYEESFKRFEEGEVVTGKVVSVDKDDVLVDIGYKSYGQIAILEFNDKDGHPNVRVGDRVEVMVEWWDDENEVVVLSKEKAEKVRVWKDLKDAYENDSIVDGVITERIKGGFRVDIGVIAFLPFSQVDLRPVSDPKTVIGRTMQFRILEYNRKRSNIVVSRRVLLEAEREIKKTETLSGIREGKVFDGTVVNIMPYGLFVDIGGIDGLLHKKNITHERTCDLFERFSAGQKIRVVVLKFDADTEKISLGMKQLGEETQIVSDE